jgi:inositol hexakisphosphate/diphosphoinositol-pentakisphosphate kinase
MTSLHRSLKKIGNPRKALAAIYSAIGNLCLELEVMFGGVEEDVVEGGHMHSFHSHQEVLSGIKLYKGETLQELYDRWTFVQDKFYDRKKDRFDLSTIPDVHDNARFDMLHVSSPFVYESFMY